MACKFSNSATIIAEHEVPRCFVSRERFLACQSGRGRKKLRDPVRALRRGVMGSFLLGDTIRASTRHAASDEDRGVEFTATISVPLIGMTWCRRNYGTTICIHVTRPEVLDQFANPETWDWYRLAKPSLCRKLIMRCEGGNQSATRKIKGSGRTVKRTQESTVANPV